MKRIESNPVPAQPPQWSEFERLVDLILDRALESESAVTHVLRQQRAYATLSEIDYTGHGFYAQIELKEGNWGRADFSGVIDPGNFSSGETGEAYADLIGAVVYVRDGALDCVEAHGNPDWPAEVSGHVPVDLGR